MYLIYNVLRLGAPAIVPVSTAIILALSSVVLPCISWPTKLARDELSIVAAAASVSLTLIQSIFCVC